MVCGELAHQLRVHPAIKISKEKSHELKGEQGGVYGTAWREEGKGRNFVIII